MRVFAEKTNANRESEVLGLQAGMRIGLGPRLIAIFDNGVVMDFVKGRNLTYTDYADSTIMKYVKPFVIQKSQSFAMMFNLGKSLQMANDSMFHFFENCYVTY